MKLKILAIVALAVVGVGAAFVALGGGLPTTAASTTRYLTSAVATGDVTDQVAATGSVAASDSYGVSFGVPAHIAGATATGSGASTTWKVTSLHVKVGDTVKKGADLATADTSDLKRQLADAVLSIQSAKIQLSNANDALDAATTTQATRQAQMSVYQATTQVSDLRKTRDDLQTQIKLAKLTAPIDGIVTAVNIVNGLDAPSGDAIVIDAPTFQITTDVVESDLASMAVGQTATVSIAAVDATVDGKVTSIAPTATGNTTGSVVNYAGRRLAVERAGQRPRRDDRRRHDHHRQRDRGHDDPGGRPPRGHGQLHRPGDGRGRARRPRSRSRSGSSPTPRPRSRAA